MTTETPLTCYICGRTSDEWITVDMMRMSTEPQTPTFQGGGKAQTVWSSFGSLLAKEVHVGGETLSLSTCYPPPRDSGWIGEKPLPGRRSGASVRDHNVAGINLSGDSDSVGEGEEASRYTRPARGGTMNRHGEVTPPPTRAGNGVQTGNLASFLPTVSETGEKLGATLRQLRSLRQGTNRKPSPFRGREEVTGLFKDQESASTRFEEKHGEPPKSYLFVCPSCEDENPYHAKNSREKYGVYR